MCHSPPSPCQRPTAHELLRHRFLKVARKTSYMTELIDRYRRWRLENSEEEDLTDDTDNGRKLVVDFQRSSVVSILLAERAQKNCT